jgi:hypothetical protein
VERFPQYAVNCSICHSPVELETAKTNDDGDTVHEECYVLQLVSNKRSALPATAPKTMRSPAA